MWRVLVTVDAIRANEVRGKNPVIFANEHLENHMDFMVTCLECVNSEQVQEFMSRAFKLVSLRVATNDN